MAITSGGFGEIYSIQNDWMRPIHTVQMIYELKCMAKAKHISLGDAFSPLLSKELSIFFRFVLKRVIAHGKQIDSA